MIERIRQECCPAAGRLAAMIGIVKALPQLRILIQAELALRKSEAARAMQVVIDVGLDDPTPAFHAVYVTVNDAGKERGANLR